MYGWRRRIGLLVPANNTVVEPELGARLPAGVAMYATRLMVEGDFAPEALHRMEGQTERGLAELAVARVDLAVYACLSTSLAKGPAWDLSFPRRRRTPVFTAASATVGALRALGAVRVAFLTPYPAAIQRLVTPYFRALGFDPVAAHSLDLAGYDAVGRVAPAEVRRLARGVDLGGAEAVCVLATDLATLEAIEAMEADLGLPVVTTNQAILWRSLAGMRAGGGPGRLLRP